MNPNSIVKCHSRLRNARKALGELKACTDFQTFSDSWVQFLQAWKGIYTTLEQGAKDTDKSRQWYGSKVKKERKADPLLMYLFEARNDEEHGLGRSLDAGMSALFPATGGQKIMMLVRVKNGVETPVALDIDTNEIIEPSSVNRTGAILNAVEARGARVIAPPIKHLEMPLDDLSPLNVAILGLAYVENLVKTAESLEPSSKKPHGPNF